MPVKNSVVAIFGVTVVFHLEGLYRAEALMVISHDILHHNFTVNCLTVN